MLKRKLIKMAELLFSIYQLDIITLRLRETVFIREYKKSSILLMKKIKMK